MSRRRTLPWFDSLTESVYALGEAAREYRHAYRAAVLVKETVDLDRRRLHDGQIDTVRTLYPGEPHTHHSVQSPHDHAVYRLGDLHLQRELDLHRLYEHAALLYASGAVWAIREVQTGAQPPRVAFERDKDDVVLPRARLNITGLERYSDAGKVAAAYRALAMRLDAGEHAESLAQESYLADHEASEMHDALDASQGIADAAFLYGLQAERAVHYVLLEPKREHARQEALQRATEQAGETGA
ncbi:hypothetical protein AB0903_09195 [Streptomyces sp. NPDC048389]|uniref:hypothetical protein n=1 Tax=Streptomyces sp. NPDC048389 TaxID=3154622 RepID=UPI0034534980